MSDEASTDSTGQSGWAHWLAPAIAGGLGWGIRGQFGGEMGAIIPGALIGLTAGWLARRKKTRRQAAKIGAAGALACSFGGMTTYGQTLGLVHDRPPTGRRLWGLLGLAVKGGAWFGLTGLWMGVAGAPRRYRLAEAAALAGTMAAGFSVGALALNAPMEPPAELPAIYFSKRLDAKPRIECWGGLWGALAAGLGYVGLLRQDRFASALALVGVAGGAAGFVGGELLQWGGSWTAPLGERAQPWIDWWKVMEVTFGAVAAVALVSGWRALELHGVGDEPVRELPTPVNAVLAAAGALVTAALFPRLPPARNMDRRVALASLVGLPLVVAEALPGAAIVGPAVTLAGGLNVYEDWTSERGLLGPGVAAGLLGLIVGGAALLAWWRRGDDARLWLPLTAWAQTGLTVALMWPKAGWRSSAGVVELAFVLAAAGLTAVTMREPAEEGGEGAVGEEAGSAV